MFESTKKFICQEIKRQLENISLHRHNSFYPTLPKPPHVWPEAKNIDETVRHLIQDSRDKTSQISQLQADLAAIHAHYRSELCNDCCHSEVCKLRPNVKYGFECEDKAYELEVELFEVEPEKVETEKEEANEGL